MKILINKTDKNILPITKIYDLGSVTTTINDLLNESTIILEKNITPILSIDGSNYLINNFNSTNIKEDFEAIITESDLISLGGGSSSGDFIPLSGTTVGNPITGNLKFGNEENFLIATDDVNTSAIKITNYGSVGLESEIDGTTSSFNLKDGNAVYSNNNILSKGLSGFQDFTANITDLDYVQKKYVDQKVADSRPYKVYTALLTQVGANAPVAKVLENTLGGNIVWTRDFLGEYTGTLTGEFLFGKTFYPTYGSTSGFDKVFMHRLDDNTFKIYTLSNDETTPLDNLLHETPIEIRVYN